MGTAPAILFGCLLSAAEPVSAEELQVAVAAVEESHTRLNSIEVTYRVWYTSPARSEGSAVQPAGAEYTYEWAWKAGKEHLLSTSESSRSEWWHDRRKTSEWIFDGRDLENPIRVWISHAPPRLLLSGNILANIMGFRVFSFDGGILPRIQDAVRQKTLSGRRAEAGLLLDLGSQDFNRVPHDIRVTVDPRHDHRLVSWSLERDVTVDVEGQLVPDAHRYLVDEFQSVTDEASGTAVWFPLRGHLEQPSQVTWLAVDSVRINPDLPDKRFTPPEMSFGTEVSEEITPGKPPKRYLVGGTSAEQERLERLAEIAAEERAQLDRNGVTYDAAPRTNSRVLPATILGVLCLAVGGYLRWRRSRVA